MKLDINFGHIRHFLPSKGVKCQYISNFRNTLNNVILILKYPNHTFIKYLLINILITLVISLTILTELLDCYSTIYKQQ